MPSKATLVNVDPKLLLYTDDRVAARGGAPGARGDSRFRSGELRAGQRVFPPRPWTSPNGDRGDRRMQVRGSAANPLHGCIVRP